MGVTQKTGPIPSGLLDERDQEDIKASTTSESARGERPPTRVLRMISAESRFPVVEDGSEPPRSHIFTGHVSESQVSPRPAYHGVYSQVTVAKYQASHDAGSRDFLAFLKFPAQQAAVCGRRRAIQSRPPCPAAFVAVDGPRSKPTFLRWRYAYLAQSELRSYFGDIGAQAHADVEAFSHDIRRLVVAAYLDINV